MILLSWFTSLAVSLKRHLPAVETLSRVHVQPTWVIRLPLYLNMQGQCSVFCFSISYVMTEKGQLRPPRQAYLDSVTS